MAEDIVGSKSPSLPSGAYSKSRGAQGQGGPQPSSTGMGGNIDWTTGPRQLRKALDISPPGGDATLEALKAGKQPTNFQTRTLTGDNVAGHDGTKDANVGGAPRGDVPGKLGK